MRPASAARDILALEPLAPIAHANSLVTGFILIRCPAAVPERTAAISVFCAATMAAGAMADTSLGGRANPNHLPSN